MPIPIAEATEAAVRAALLRHWCVAGRDRRPPHQHVPAEASAVAGELLRALVVCDLLRGTRRDVPGLKRKALAAAARLAALGLAPPA
jgi:hypothetical protein